MTAKSVNELPASKTISGDFHKCLKGRSKCRVIEYLLTSFNHTFIFTNVNAMIYFDNNQILQSQLERSQKHKIHHSKVI